MRFTNNEERNLITKQFRRKSNDIKGGVDEEAQAIEFEIEGNESNQWFNFCEKSLYSLSEEHPSDTFGKLHSQLVKNCQDFRICRRFQRTIGTLVFQLIYHS